MEKEQEREWAEAQKITISTDLVIAAKNQLKFLAAVDRNRYLYEGPLLEWAIYRYNAYWLPLLAKHLENPVSDEPLVVPLDCEWIWHCHRLNPVRYMTDCQTLFGRILGTHNVVSSVKGTQESKTEEIWSKMYPEEPYELDPNRTFLDVSQKNIQSENFTSYDLVSAVKRQVSFCYQVSRPHVSDDLYLQEALARYKGFLHLIRTNRKNNVRRFCVPIYDVDLMWHSHQLHPVSYCNDLKKLLGNVLEHDDTHSDRGKGKRLDTGFSVTTKQWEETFGSTYWKAGAMYRGPNPTPVTQTPYPFVYEGKKSHSPNKCSKLIEFQEMKAIEVLLKFEEIKNLPEEHKGNLCVSFSKNQPDKLFSAKKTLPILPESGEKQAAYFQCEPTGELLFELLCNNILSNKPASKSIKPFGSCSLSFKDCVAFGSKLSVDKWLPVVPVSGILASKPILLHVSLSFTPPTLAPQVFQLVQPQPFFKDSCFLQPQTYVINDDGNDILSLQMRDLSKSSTRSNPNLLKEIHCTTGDSYESHTLAELQGNEWVIYGSHGSMKLRCTSENIDYFYELVGHKMVRLYAGRKLDYEPKHWENLSEHGFMTAVEFSSEYPYGKAVALFDFKHGNFKVMDEWMILTGITLAFIMRSEGCFTAKVGCEDIIQNQVTNSTSPEVDSGGLCGGGYCGARCVGGCLTANAEQGEGLSYSGAWGSDCGKCGFICLGVADHGNTTRVEMTNFAGCDDSSSECDSIGSDMAKCDGGSCGGGGKCGGGSCGGGGKCGGGCGNMEK